MMVGSDVSAPPFIFNFHYTSFSYVQECLDQLTRLAIDIYMIINFKIYWIN